MRKPVECQWIEMPLGGQGQVSIGDQAYGIAILFDERPDGRGGNTRILLRRENKRGRTEYQLHRSRSTGDWQCDCPAAIYHAAHVCKHMAAMDVLLAQLVEEYGSKTTRTDNLNG
jgi:hypothetical protein